MSSQIFLFIKSLHSICFSLLSSLQAEELFIWLTEPLYENVIDDGTEGEGWIRIGNLWPLIDIS